MLSQYGEHCKAHKGFFCSTIRCVRTPRQIPLKQSGSRNLKFFHPPTPQYSTDQVPSDYHMFGPLRKCLAHEHFPVMIKLKTLRIRRLVNRYATSGTKKREIMLINDTLCICHRLLYKQQLINTLNFSTLPRSIGIWFTLCQNQNLQRLLCRNRN